MRKRDGRLDGHTRLYPNKNAVSPEDPALTTLKRGTELSEFEVLETPQGVFYQQSNASQQAVAKTPKSYVTVTSVSPSAGSNVSVTVRGLGFLKATSATIDGVSLQSFQALSDTVITGFVPLNVQPGQTTLVVHSVFGTAFDGSITYGFQAPVVTNLDPSSGDIDGGTVVLVKGQGFISGAQVVITDSSLVSLPCSSVEVLSPTLIRCITQAGEPGNATVVVTNVDQQSGSLVNGYVYAVSVPIISFDFTNAPLTGSTFTGMTVSRASIGSVETTEGVVLTDIPVDTPRISKNGLLVEQASTNVSYPSVLPSPLTGWWNNAGQGGVFGYFVNGPGSPAGTETVAETTIGTNGRAWNWGYPMQATASTWSFYVKNKNPDIATGMKALPLQNPPSGLTVTFATQDKGNFSADKWTRVSSYQAPTSFMTIDATQGDDMYNFNGVVNSFVMRHWGHQVESGKIATSYIPTTTGPVSRAADRPTLTNAASAVDNGTLSVSLEVVPIGAMNSSPDYPGTVRLWTSATDLTTYSEINTSGKLSISVAGSTWTSNKVMFWQPGDEVRIMTVAGNGRSQAWYQVNTGPIVNLGQSQTTNASLVLTNGLDIMCNGTSNTFSAELRRLSFYKRLQQPNWLRFPVVTGTAVYNIVPSGDSITQGIYTTRPALTSWPGQLSGLLGRTYLIRNIAISGAHQSDIATDMSSRLPVHIGAFQDNILLVQGGTNDFNGVNTTATIFGFTQSVINTGLLLGCKVIVGTILPRTDFNGGFEAQRQDYNTMVRNTYGNNKVANVWVADIGNDPTIGQVGQNTNGTYFVDGVHPTDAGDAIIAPYYQTQVLLAVSSS